MKGVQNTSSNPSNGIQLRTSNNENVELPQKQKNEIRYLDYIQVVSSIVFAIVGIIMSCQSNSIYERQKEIQEKTISPAIDISVVLKDNSEEYATDIVDRFIVKNVGGIANYVDCYVRPFFLTHYSEFISGEETFTDGVIVPIISYTDDVIANVNLGFRSGEIAHIYPNDNLLNIVDMIDEWGNFQESIGIVDNKKIVHVSIGYFLEIDCQDLFENDWTEYYVCFPGYEAIYSEFPCQNEIRIGITKINDEEMLEIAEGCFGRGVLMPSCYIYEKGLDSVQSYLCFLQAFHENCDMQFNYSIMLSGEYDLIEYPDGCFLQAFFA